MIDPGQVAIGIVVLLVTVGALLYIFYSRTNAVEKTGYGALIMLGIVSLMIPVFWITESNAEQNANTTQHDIAVQRGAALFAQNCYQCHGTKGQGRIGPKLNGNDAVNQLGDSDIIRIISGGIADNAQPSKLLMPTWSDRYGGPLSDAQIQYLFALIRSSDPAYLQKNGYANKNGFAQVPDLIQQNSASAYGTAQAQESSAFGTAIDKTNQKELMVNITDQGPSCSPSCFEFPNVKVKVGTKITWVNKSAMPHTVTVMKGTNTSSPIPLSAKGAFDSGASPFAPSTGTFTTTITMDTYNLDPIHHTVIYFCRIHPGMLAELTIVP